MPKPIVVPPWQRSYSWKPTEVDQFWNDILSFSEDCSPGGPFGAPQYFIGSIVLVSSEELPHHILLDGQQRLVTSTLLLAAIRDYILSEADSEDHESRQLATKLGEKYIVSQEMFETEEVPRITLNVYDQPYFRDFIQKPKSGTADLGVKPELESHKRIRRSYQLLLRRLREHLTDHSAKDGIRWAHWLAGVLTMNLLVIVATSDDEDTAAEIFETLNDRGIGLSTPDLLRNLLLRRSPETYREEIINRWRDILRIEEVARADVFLRHFWISRNGDVKKHSLYREMRNYINGTSAPTYPLTLTKEMEDAGSVYQDLVGNRDDDDDIARLLHDVSLLDAFSLRPALLSAWGHGDAEERKRLLKALIAFYVRHRVIVGLENNEFEGVVFSLAKDLRESGDFDAAVGALRSAPPSDDDFQNSFETITISRADTVRYLLTEFERRRHPNQELAVEAADKVHVEHIYPQSPPDKWRADDHEQIVNRLGNLTLLGKKLNQTVANSDFATKRDHVPRGYKHSDLKITRDIGFSPYDKLKFWTINEIDARQKMLAEEAGEIWKI